MGPIIAALIAGALLGSWPQSVLAQNSRPPIRDCPDCPELVPVPAQPDRGPFLAGVYEVTWREYIQAYLDGSCGFPYVGLPVRSISDPQAARTLQIDWPVTGVSLQKVSCYLDWLKRKTGRTYRLPTAEEWEWLARGGVGTRFPWGEHWAANRAAIVGRFDLRLRPRPLASVSLYLDHHAVGQFQPNPFGIHDVIGNAMELTSTCRPLPSPDALVKIRTAECRRVLKGIYWPDAKAGFTGELFVDPGSDMKQTGFRVIAEMKKEN